MLKNEIINAEDKGILILSNLVGVTCSTSDTINIIIINK